MGQKLTFKRGLHPYDFKKMSMDMSITDYSPEGEIIIPMAQHLGAPANAIVAKGDAVKVGQVIGEPSGFVSAYVHSSVSGVVKELRTITLSNGAKGTAVVIENDNLYQTVPTMNVENKLEELSDEKIRECVKMAGIVGLGGAGFPTHIKLTPPTDKKIDYVIVNGSECEPYLTSDYRIMLEQPLILIEGLKIILRLFKDAKGIIGIEDNKPKAYDLLKELVGNNERIEVLKLKTKYPQGAEKQLVYATTGRKFSSKKLPLDVGCIVQNVDTVIAVRNAVMLNNPLITRIVTMTGNGINQAHNFRVRVGTNLEELIRACGGFKDGVTPEKIIAGGPMMGNAMYTTNIPITKGTSAFVFIKEDEVSKYKERNCIRCGKCVSTCPNGLLPLYLSKASIDGDAEEFEKLNGLECCECGCCSYICPSKRHLTQAIRTMRRDILSKKKKK